MTTSRPPDKDALPEAIAKEEAQLADLERARQATQARLDAFKAELASRDADPAIRVRLPVLPPPSAPTTPSEKVALFRHRFRGREDVYPKLWTNAKSGKNGYAPACSNEWVRGICEKPRVKCGECPNQAFIPVSDQAILDHLQGRHVIGVYPLINDETCWFLARSS